MTIKSEKEAGKPASPIAAKIYLVPATIKQKKVVRNE